jgi:DNA-binding NarL/FixJ family response regulator
MWLYRAQRILSINISYVVALHKGMHEDLACSTASRLREHHWWCAYAGSWACDMLSRIMGISDQERQILDLLSEGCSIKEIAERMGTSVEVVKVSIDEILEKVASLPPYRKRGYAVS